jgi:hypothetical protein
MVGGRGVWQGEGGLNGDYLFFASSVNRWYVSDEEDMRAGKDTGWVRTADAEPDALTPDQVKGAWQVADGKAWVAAPNARVQRQ